ncbi:MAG: glycine cleavage system protein GcvH [Armatimonadota bacterium]|jgi:glycine cleavage system H protein
MEFPDDLKYTEGHMWARVEGSAVTLGVTAYASEEMGEIVYVQLPDEGEQAEAGEPFGSIESTKAIEDLMSPVGGKVAKVNSEVVDAPETINRDPYGEGWLLVVEAGDVSPVEGLLSAEDYQKQVEA